MIDSHVCGNIDDCEVLNKTIIRQIVECEGRLTVGIPSSNGSNLFIEKCFELLSLFDELE